MLWAAWPGETISFRNGAVVLFVAVIVMLIVATKGGGPTSAGLGPDWNCTNSGQGDPVCVKKIQTGDKVPSPANKSR
jgi:hypothetical protein